MFFANVNFRQIKDNQNRLFLNDGKVFFKDEPFARLLKEQMHTVDGDFFDLDSDGDLDLLTGNGFGNSYAVYRNNGKGVFTNETDSFIPFSIRGDGIDLEVADFNGDGLPDLYLCNFLGNDFLLFRKNTNRD